MATGPFGLAFCRIVIGVVFAWSFAGKVRDVPAFARTISRFRLLPGRLQRPAAVACLGSELAVAGAMLLGGGLLEWGFLLAALMLAVLCIALASVLMRKIRTSCNCFGASDRPVSPYDLVRNAGFIACAFGGYSLYAAAPGRLTAPGVLEWGLAGVVAAVFVVVWVQVGEIVQLYR